jgi:hypothetical protein
LRPEEDFHLQVQCHAWHTMGPGLRRESEDGRIAVNEPYESEH